MPCKGSDYSERLQSIQFIIDDMLPRQENVKIKLIIVEQSLDGKTRFADTLVKRHSRNVIYDFVVVKYPVFNKSWLCNIGVTRAEGEHLFVADNDIYCEKNFFYDLVLWATTNGHKWCFAWSHLYYADYNEKHSLIAGNPVTQFLQDRIIAPQKRKAEGGIVYFKKEFYNSIGKFHEWFEGLGGMDNEIIDRANFTTKSYPKFNNFVYHLWHQRKPIRKERTRVANIILLKHTRENMKKVIGVLRRQVFGKLSQPACKDITFYHAMTKI